MGTGYTLSKNVILCGLDCTGKTSIVKELEEIYDVKQVIHTGPPSSEKAAKKKLGNLVAKLNMNKGIIMDRCFFVDEAVYAPKYRNYNPNWIRGYERGLADHNYLFMVTANCKDIEDRFDGEFIDRYEIRNLHAKFNQEYLMCEVKHKHVIDTTYLNPKGCALEIKRILEVDEQWHI